MKQLFTLLLVGTFSIHGKAQVKIGANPGSIHPGSVLELEHTTKGLRMPQIALTNTTTWAPLQGSGTDATTRGMAVYNTNAAMTSTNANYPANGIGEYYWDGTGWVNKNSSNTQSSLVFFSVRRSTQQTAIDGTPVVVDFNAETFDKNSNFNINANTFTVPANGAGFYQINGSFVSSPQATGQGAYLGLYVNNVLRRNITVGNAAASAGIAANGTIAVRLNAGDVISVKYLANTASQEFTCEVDIYQLSR